MKIKNLLLLASSIFMLAGCSAGDYFYPSKGGNWVAPPVKEGDDDDDNKTTYNFYFSFWTTTKYNEFLDKDEDSPILSFEFAMLKPLGKAPDEVAVDGSEDPNAIDEAKVLALGAALGYTPDPYYDKFLGFSFNGGCLDESGLWDFTKDYKQMSTVTLFGIWVHESL